MLRTDIFQRGVPWMLLMLRSKVAETDLNVSPASGSASRRPGLGLLGLVAAPIARPRRPSSASNLVDPGGLNRDFYRFLARRRGWGFAIGSFPLHYLYFCCCGAVGGADRPGAQAAAVAAPRAGPPAGPASAGTAADATTAPARGSAEARRPTRWTKP